MVAVALVDDTDGFEEEYTRTIRRCKSWSPGQRIRLADELCINAPTSSDETTMCSSRLASKQTITTDQDVMPPHSEATSICEEDNSLEGDVKEGADEYDVWGDTDLEGDEDYSSARCAVKKASWADPTDQALGPVIGLGGQVLGGAGALQQRAGTSELRAWTESVCEAPAAAGPRVHAGTHAAGWWAAGSPREQSKPPIAGLPPLISSRRGPSSGADAAASLVGTGSNRKAGRFLTKSTTTDGSTPHSGKVTTVMVRNLPPTLKQQDFLRELDVTGFENTYDFCYLPRDFSSGQCQGHAFVNFKEAADASQFRAVWHKTERFGRRDRLVDVSPARIQGYEANARAANSSKGRKVKNPSFRSLIKVQAAEPPPPLGHPSGGGTAAFAAPAGSDPSWSSPASFHGCPCHGAGHGVANSARPVPQELLGTHSNIPARPAAQCHVTPRMLVSSPAGVPRAAPDGVTVAIFTLVGSPQHSVLHETPTLSVTSFLHYSSVAAR